MDRLLRLADRHSCRRSSLLAGYNSSKEYAELEWPFDIAITILWVAFAVVFFGTIAIRKIRPIYISNWFYGALIIVIAMLHIVNNLAIPVTWTKSYSLFAGGQDAIVEWWYGHNAVGFLLTGGFLGMLYYFLPKQGSARSGAIGCPSWRFGPLPTATSGPDRITFTTTPSRNGYNPSAW